jgi:acyl carrier protein
MQVSATSGETARAASRPDIAETVVEWLRVELDDAEITGADNFLDVGGHSLVFSKLNKFLNESFGVVLDQRRAYEDPLSAAATAALPSESSGSTTR